MAVFKQSQSVVACEICHDCGNRVVAVEGNDHNDFGLDEIAQTAKEVAYRLMDICCMFGAPFIL